MERAQVRPGLILVRAVPRDGRPTIERRAATDEDATALLYAAVMLAASSKA